MGEAILPPQALGKPLLPLPASAGSCYNLGYGSLIPVSAHGLLLFFLCLSSLPLARTRVTGFRTHQIIRHDLIPRSLPIPAAKTLFPQKVPFSGSGMWTYLLGNHRSTCCALWFHRSKPGTLKKKCLIGVSAFKSFFLFLLILVHLIANQKGCLQEKTWKVKPSYFSHVEILYLQFRCPEGKILYLKMEAVAYQNFASYMEKVFLFLSHWLSTLNVCFLGYFMIESCILETYIKMAKGVT